MYTQKSNILSEYKNNTLINKKSIFIKNSFLLILFLFISVFGFSQNKKIPNKDSLKTNHVKPVSIGDTIKTFKDKKGDTKKDSIKNAIISKDAITEVIDYSCNDSLMMSMGDKMIYLYGGAVIVSGDINLKSDYVEINTTENYLFAHGVSDSSGIIKGSPVFKEKNDEFDAKSLKYNFKTKQGIVKDVITEHSQGYLHGGVSKIHENKQIHIYDGKYTTCDLDHPHFYIELTKAKVIPDKRIVSGPMYFVIADIPLYILGLPFGLIPSQKKNTSGLLMPKYGEEARRGFYLSNGGYFWAINDNYNASITFDIYSKGSWGTEFTTNFKKLYKFNGGLSIQYSKNVNGEIILPDYTEEKTFWVRGNWAQDQKANPNSNFSATLNFGSSAHSSYTAVNLDQLTDNTKSSSISYQLTKPGSIFNLSSNLNYTQNTATKTTNLSLPVVSLNMKTVFPFESLGKGQKWYQKIGVSVSTSLKNTVNSPDSTLLTMQTLSNMSNGFKYSVPISTSFKLFKYFTVAPSINYNGRIYGDYIEKRQIQMIDENDSIYYNVASDTIKGFRHPMDFSFSVPIRTKIFGLYKFKKGKINAIRHVVTPAIGFNYRPDFSNSFWGYYGQYVDNKGEEVSYAYDGIGIFGYPPSGKSGAISFTLGNNFEMKMKTKKDTSNSFTKIILLNNLSFSTSYNIAADSLRWANPVINGNTTIFKNVNVNFNANFDFYTKDTLGVKINKFEWDENGKIARLVSAGISLSGSLNPNSDKDKNKKPKSNIYLYQNPEIAYADFSVPWDIQLGYDFRLTNTYDKTLQKYVKDVVQTISMTASLTITKNWSVSVRNEFDVSAGKFIHTDLNIHRDLHCWEMGLNLIPYGPMKSYNFRINIKSSVFKGIEYKKQRSRLDNYD